MRTSNPFSYFYFIQNTKICFNNNMEKKKKKKKINNKRKYAIIRKK